MLDFVDATYQIAIIYKAYNAPFLKWFNVATNFKEEHNTHSVFIRVVYPVDFSGISWRELLCTRLTP
jgi:hypothetical protein